MKRTNRLLTLLTPLILTLGLSGQTNNPSLKIYHLTGGFYIYTTYNAFNNTPFPSNSMYMVTDKGVAMFDTPWDTTQFQPLLDSIEKRHAQKVILCIATHYHDDRTGGLGFLNAKGIKTYTSKQTYDLCKQNNMNQASSYFERDTVFRIGQSSFQTYYGGEGHTKDNIIIWFEKEKILYGGCLIKSVEATDLGNTKDASPDKWRGTLRNIKKKFPAPAFIIPGHHDWKSTRSLDHTLQLLRIQASQER